MSLIRDKSRYNLDILLALEHVWLDNITTAYFIITLPAAVKQSMKQ